MKSIENFCIIILAILITLPMLKAKKKNNRNKGQARAELNASTTHSEKCVEENKKKPKKPYLKSIATRTRHRNNNN